MKYVLHEQHSGHHHYYNFDYIISCLRDSIKSSSQSRKQFEITEIYTIVPNLKFSSSVIKPLSRKKAQKTLDEIQRLQQLIILQLL